MAAKIDLLWPSKINDRIPITRYRQLKQWQKPLQQNPLTSYPAMPFTFFIFCVYLHALFNTLWNRYAIDDTIVVTDNKFTKRLLVVLKTTLRTICLRLFGERGAKLVSGGRYRPLSRPH
ncbi:MAG: hypothetical protein IPL84_04120 [Chitinophagaceae bacterium]|nr:hypothetical protein [Chitinophagaceae bacterium]